MKTKLTEFSYYDEVHSGELATRQCSLMSVITRVVREVCRRYK